MESNADYSIYYMGISANQIIKTDPVVVTVTNVFDDWSTYFTGATDKSDKSAKKTWKFREVSWGSVCNMGAHGGWKYTSAGYTPESNFAWWANVTAAEAGDQSMVFEFDGNKMKTYDASGNLKAEVFKTGARSFPATESMYSDWISTGLQHDGEQSL